jgi:hypothetical protein
MRVNMPVESGGERAALQTLREVGRSLAVAKMDRWKGDDDLLGESGGERAALQTLREVGRSPAVAKMDRWKGG